MKRESVEIICACHLNQIWVYLNALPTNEDKRAIVGELDFDLPKFSPPAANDRMLFHCSSLHCSGFGPVIVQGGINVSNFDWPVIRQLYQSGRTAYALAKIPGNPSKQAIMKRAKKEGWAVGNSEGNPVTVSQLSPPALFNGDSIKGRILAQLAEGATYKLAAACIGVSDRTLRDWREQDPAFASACNSARAQHRVKLVKYIDRAAERDWKAAAWRLERDEETREDFASRSAHGFPPGITVVLNVDRSKVPAGYEHVIDGHPDRVKPVEHNAQPDERSQLRHDPLGRVTVPKWREEN